MQRLFLAVLMVLLPCSNVLAQSFNETFATTTYRDAGATTAVWDTAEGTVHLASADITWIGGRAASGANRVLQAGGTAYLARGASGVELIDATNPLAPSLTGSIPYGGVPPQVVLDIALTGDILYVAWVKTISVLPLVVTYGVDVYSVASPSSPVYVQTLALMHAEGLTVHGNRLYMATGSALSIWDITDPAFPASLGSIALGGTPQAVAVSGTIAYVAAGSVGFQVVDVSNPAAPVLRATRAIISAEGIDADGPLVAVAAGATGVRLYDAATPNNPVMLGSWSGGTAHTVRLDGDVATVAAGSAGLVFLDVADPSNPVVMESDASITTVRDATASGTLVFAAHDGGLAVYRGAQTPVPVSLERSATTGSTANPTALRVSGDYAYMADGVLRVYDVTRTAPLTSVATWGTLGVRVVDVDGSYAYVDAAGTFTVLDVSNPSSPAVVGSYATGTSGLASDIVVHGSLVFLSYQFDGLYVLDVSNPSAPALLDTYASSSVMDLEVSGANVYMASGGLRILSAVNPASIVSLGSYTSAGVTSVAISGHYAFLGGGTGGHQGLEVIDVSNPAAPVKVGGVDFVPQRMAVSRNILLVAGAQPLLVMDISDPTNPTTLSSYAPGGTHINYDVAGYGDMAYLAQWFSPSEGRLLELRTFDRGVESAGNTAVSTTVATTDYSLGALRMTPTSQGSISWWYSSNGGASFSPRQADGSWESAASGATAELRWKAVLNVAAGQPAPVCSNLTMEWRSNIGLITSIADVPADQGGAVQIDFLASGYELAGGLAVTSYAILRRSATSWDSVAVVTPTGADAYSVVAPTLVDSTLWDGVTYSVYKIRTWFSTPTYLESPPDSGYSVDNIAPGPPTDVSVKYNTGAGNLVQWSGAPDPDVIFYRIYRDQSVEVPVSPATVVDSVPEKTLWYDPTYDGWNVFYAVTTVDSAGNESLPGYPGVTTGAEDPPVPQDWALEQNVPNPFNPTTRILFAVPAGGGRVSLTVFDVAGRRIATLLDRAVPPGVHGVTWDGRDARGRRVSSGVYFYRLQTPDGMFTRKMTLVE
jgi:hypothetical protein